MQWTVQDLFKKERLIVFVMFNLKEHSVSCAKVQRNTINIQVTITSILGQIHGGLPQITTNLQSPRAKKAAL